MQGLADGYFIIPYTLGNYLASSKLGEVSADHPAFKDAEAGVTQRLEKLLSIKGRRTVDDVPPRPWAKSCGTTAAWPATSRS